MSRKDKTAEQQPPTQPLPTQHSSDVDVDVEHESKSHGHHDTDTNRDVTVERTTDIDWTIDYGGEPVHPTRISSKGYTLPPVQPESS